MKYNDQPGYGSLKPLNRLQQKKYGEIIVNKTKPGLRSASSINNMKISGCEGNWDILYNYLIL